MSYQVKYIKKSGEPVFSNEFDSFEEAYECYVEILSGAVGQGENWQRTLYRCTHIEFELKTIDGTKYVRAER